jgi:His-Xaa-Ser system protein HxsD
MKQQLVTFEHGIYSVTAIKKAAYKFLNIFSAEISTEGPVVNCTLNFRSELDAEVIQTSVHDFRREVLDQDLREILKKETEQVRNLILAHAFSKTGIVKE